MAVLDDTRQSTGARGGFVSAFVRTMRRTPQSSAVGKVAVGALVIVLAAGSVVGMSVLLRGTGKNTAAVAANAAGGAGAGSGAALVSSSPSAGTRSTTKPPARPSPNPAGPVTPRCRPSRRPRWRPTRTWPASAAR
jgi:hypothetical protein